MNYNGDFSLIYIHLQDEKETIMLQILLFDNKQPGDDFLIIMSQINRTLPFRSSNSISYKYKFLNKYTIRESGRNVIEFREF